MSTFADTTYVFTNSVAKKSIIHSHLLDFDVVGSEILPRRSLFAFISQHFIPRFMFAIILSTNFFYTIFMTYSSFSDMKTYFITGRTKSSDDILDTRLARRTSSTPATFLVPTITKTDVDAHTVSLVIDLRWIFKCNLTRSNQT